MEFLVEKRAFVNSTTKTKSTPLRAACYDGHLEIVQFLIENGADVEIANRHGHTCLMIACYKGHFRIAKYLIDCGSNVNRKSVKGNTALHDCAESGSLEIMKLLLSKSAVMEVDSYGVTPLIAAALTGHSPIVELIIQRSFGTADADKIEALELLGSTFVDKKRDMMGALEYWRRAVKQRNESGLILTPRKGPIDAYSGALEVTTEVQLEELFSDPDDMRMQALLVRERILGPAHPDTSYYIRYRGAVYADTGNFDRCIKLWMYALEMQQKVLEALNPMIQSSLLSFAELFSFMMSKSVSTVKFADLLAVFNRALAQLQVSVIASAAASVSLESDTQNLHRTLVIILHFVGLLCRLQPFLDAEEEIALRSTLYRFIRLNPRGKNGVTPLHMACVRDTTCPSLRFPLCDFPMPEMVKILLEVGASPHEVDLDKKLAAPCCLEFDSAGRRCLLSPVRKGRSSGRTQCSGRDPASDVSSKRRPVPDGDPILPQASEVSVTPMSGSSGHCPVEDSVPRSDSRVPGELRQRPLKLIMCKSFSHHFITTLLLF